MRRGIPDRREDMPRKRVAQSQGDEPEQVR